MLTERTEDKYVSELHLFHHYTDITIFEQLEYIHVKIEFIFSRVDRNIKLS